MSYSLTLGDSEAITLDVALKKLLKLSQDEIAAGNPAPYSAYIHNIEKILEQLHKNSTQVSGSYVNDEGKDVIWMNVPTEPK